MPPPPGPRLGWEPGIVLMLEGGPGPGGAPGGCTCAGGGKIGPGGPCPRCPRLSYSWDASYVGSLLQYS